MILPAINIPTLVSPRCPSLPLTFPSATAKQRHDRYHLPLGLVQHYLSLYRVTSPSPSLSPSRPQLRSLSTTHPLFPSLSRSLSHRPACPPNPRRRHCHCHGQDGSFHRSALWDPPSSHHHHPHRSFHLNSVVWLVLSAAWRHNHCPEIIATVPREMLAGAYKLSQAGCQRIAAIDLIPECTGIVAPPIVHLVAGFVKYLPHIWVEGCPPLPKRRTPAPAVRPYQLELWQVASCDWIKNNYILKEVPGPLILDAADILYPYESTDVFWDQSLHTVPIQWQASIYNRCRHFCLSISLPLTFAAVLWCHRCKLKMKLHLRRYYYDTVECSGRKPRVNIQSCVGYLVCFGTRGILLWKSRGVEIVISKKYFRPVGMAPSEWTRSVRVVSDTPVADYSAPGINSTRRIPYRPLIAVSLFLPVLSVFYFKRSLWRCGQLWPYVGMGSLGTRLHRDCNAMGDTAKISPRVPSTCAQIAIHSLLIIRDCNGWRCENPSSRSFYLRPKCNSLLTNYTHHSKWPDLCGYWQSNARSVRLLSYY